LVVDFPQQQASVRKVDGSMGTAGSFDMREHLDPRRLTLVMWDNAFVLRHGPGGSFEDFDRVLDEAIERGYNTLRLDPMPQWIDLLRPERELSWPDPKQPLMPWNWNTAVKGPVGAWIIEFVEKMLSRKLHYTVSAWWPMDEARGPKPLRRPKDHREGAEMWVTMLTEWKRRFGFEGLVYVDLANEVPYFFPGFLERMKEATGCDWGVPAFGGAQSAFIARELNEALDLLRREFPELRFTASIHGDVRWLDVPVEFDCLDVHFYADADPRWTHRTRFHERMPVLFTDDSWHEDYSDRCNKARAAAAPMFRARQRGKLGQFAAWAQQRGMPLTTSESWASWYMIDRPGIDWGWLLEWAEWSVDDAIEYGMWGWTPHNYCQPQFENWKDVRWHRRLTERFLRS